jgi:pimeloyl-ACP methyl ester carboxylesterase
MPDPTPSRTSLPLHAVTTPGDELPYVLLHGVFMDHSLWDDVLPHVGGAPTVRLDLPSHGASPDMARGATLDDHVRTVADTLDGLGIEAAVIVGHSWGGMIGLRLAHLRPDLVRGLVLSNTPLSRLRGRGRIGFAVQRMLLAAGFPPRVYGRLAAGALFGEPYRSAHAEASTALADRAARMGRRRLRESLRSVLLDPSDALTLTRGLSVPWAAIAGNDDYVLAGGVRAELAETAHLTVVRGGHTTPREDPAAVADVARRVHAAASTKVTI